VEAANMSAAANEGAAGLERRFGLQRAAATELGFRESAPGVVFAEVSNAQASATICMQGAQIVGWMPRTQSVPVIWLSNAARIVRGRPLRGGAPVCWPWFGPHPDGGDLPSHGFARTLDWHMCSSASLQTGETQIRLALQDDEQTRALWPHEFRLELSLTIGAQLRAELSTTNTGTEGFEVSEALHTYFRVGDIGEAQVQGLDGVAYAEGDARERRGRQQGDIRFHEEFDRVYLDSPADCTIVDPRLQRRIRIAQFGARSTVVWNPWTQKAVRLGDLGSAADGRGGWREMVCVESGNALDNRVAVGAGTTHCMGALYRVEA
jgi:D-hexose-6-phosphate mutarotase